MKLERSIDIPAPCEVVWRLAHDAEQRPVWDARVEAYAIEGELVAGSLFVVGWRAPMIQAISDGEYLAVEAPHRSVARIGEASLPIYPAGVATWLFEQRKRGTRVTMRFESDPAANQRAPGFLVRMLIRRATSRSLKNLRQLTAELERSGSVAFGGVAAG
ncbi:MAG: SRPBCC family protein [Dehalococcoidia bacterium]